MTNEHDVGIDDGIDGVEDPSEAGLPSFLKTNPGADWLLTWLVWLANKFNLSQGVTLHVGGLVVTGSIISGKEYLDSVADLHYPKDIDAKSENETWRKLIADGFRHFTPFYIDDSGNPRDDTAPAYIHLKDVRIVSGGGQVHPISGTLWRGKIASVDAFLVGSMSS